MKYIFLVLLIPLSTFFSKAQNLENIKNEKPFAVSGNFSVEGGLYNSKGFNNNYQPFNYILSANPTFSFYSLHIPVSFTVTQNSKSISNPFYQFGIQPEYKWMKGYLGWNQMKWTGTTLDGKTFLGAGLEINPSLFRMGFMYGTFNQKVAEDTTKLISPEPSYLRKGYAARIGMGKKDNFFDFIFLKAKDDASSITIPKDDINHAPQENAVIGFNNLQHFYKKKITWQVDGSIAGWTRDTRSEAINLGNNSYGNLLSQIIVPRMSSSYAWALHNMIQFRNDKMSLTADYKRIQPEYYSFGTNYIQSDLQKIQLNENFKALKKKLSFMLMQNYQDDDLQDRKCVKTHRANTLFGIAYNPSAKWGANVSYNAFKLFQTDGLKKVNDSTQINQIIHNITITPRYNLLRENENHSFSLLVNIQKTNDNNPVTKKYVEGNVILTSFSYNLSLVKTGWSISPTLSYMQFNTEINRTSTISPAISVGLVMKNKLNLNAAASLNLNKDNGLASTSTNIAFTANYKINNHHQFKFTASDMHGKYNTFSRSEQRMNVGYVFSF